ncbi:MAG: 5'-nucleotidase C-terminal domain-containing protein [Defluviitaleaceae bacterium]|nr:5'-nucleotidase C-terminal domain-containing protein [Defluviitaleaceae bacterium]MCL2836416.1 5'-nucleotidase C-terminal domain-containing protein [Defluviitaleaceae bacterium]
MKKFKALAVVTLVAVLALFVARPDVAFASGETTVTIYHTNDTHGRFVGGGSIMGIDMIAAIKADTPNALLVDAGDTLHGLPFVTLNRGLDAVTLMNMAGYDVFTPGNHDFNYGYERLLELEAEAAFGFVSTTITKDGAHLFNSTLIVDVDGVSIGFIGVTTPETYYKTSPTGIVGLTFAIDTDMVAAAVTSLQGAGADLIVALAHLGIDETSEYTSIWLAETVPGIDLIIDGHSHSLFEEGFTVGGTLIVSAGEYENHLGAVTVVFGEDNSVISIEAAVISAAEAQEAFEPHPELTALIEEIRAAQNLVLDVAITDITYSLSSAREPGVRTQEMGLGNLVTDAMLAATGADIALTNGGGLRADLEEGTVTIGNVIAVLPFGNYAVTKFVTPAELKLLLENGVKGAPAAAAEFPQIGGFSFTYTVDHEPGDRVLSIAIGGVAVDMADDATQYLLVTNDFMAAGGDGYTVFKAIPTENEFPALEEILRDFLLSGDAGDYSETEGRITVTDATSGTPLAPVTSGTPVAAAEGQTGVVANTPAVYVRTGPHPTYDIVTAITRGTVVAVHDLQRQWYQVTVGEVEGWVYMEYIELN